MAEVLIYQNPVPLNATTHADLCLKAAGTYEFAAQVNSVPLTAAEFAQAALSYPIVFSGDDDAPMPAAVFGLGKGENVFVEPDGSWSGGYVPAFLRRYPFVFSKASADGQLVLFLDDSYDGFNTDGKGERLFDADGEQTNYLKSVINFMQGFQASFARTELFGKRLAELNLLRPAEANLRLPDGRSTRMGGFRTVDREALKALGDADLRKMFDMDELECIYLHLASLGHIEAIAKRTTLAGEATPEVAEDAQISADAADGDVAVEDATKH